MLNWKIPLFLLLGVVAIVGLSILPHYLLPASDTASLPAAKPETSSTPPASKPGVATDGDKKLDAALKRLAELEEKLKAGSGSKPDKPDTLSTGIGSVWDRITSIYSGREKLPLPPSVAPAPKVATPALPGAESKSAPTIPPPPTTSAPDLKSWAKGILPTIPSPPSATMASLKGPGGGCSVRKEEITLTDNWVKLTDKCDVVYWYNVKAIIVAKDVDGEFFIKPGTTARVPQEVKLIAGDARFVYSTCPRAEPGTQLGFDCNPIN